MALFRICHDYDSESSSDIDNQENQTRPKVDDGINCEGNTRNPKYAPNIPSSILQMFSEEKEDNQLASISNVTSYRNHMSQDRGKWLTYVCAPLSGGGLLDVVVADLISTAKPALPTLERIIEGELHISLSKNVHIGFHIMQPLMNDIKAALTTKTRFNCYMNSIAVYPNDDYTRTFLAIEIYGGYEQLRSLTNSINECFRKYQLPPFYEPPSFHISIGWCPGNQVDKFNQSIMNKLQTKLEEYLEDLNPVTIEYLECRCGNKLYKFSLLAVS